MTANRETALLRRQKVLADFGDFALQSEDLDEILTQACKLVADAMETGRAKVLQIEEGGSTLLLRAGTGWASDIVGKARISMNERSSESFSIRERRPVISNDVTQDGRFDVPGFMKDAGVRALANVPVLLPGGRAFGLLQVDASEPRDFDQDDVEFLRTYATILGPIVDRILKVSALRQSESRYRAFVTASSDVVYRMSPDWTEMRRLHGQGFLEDTPEPAYGWMEQYIEPEDRAEVAAAISAAISNKSMFDLQHRVRQADGSIGWTRSRAAPILDGNGDIVEWLGAARDVTAQQAAQEQLGRSETRLKNVLNGMDEAFGLMDHDFRILAFNKAAQQFEGRAPEEFLGRSHWEVFPGSGDTKVGRLLRRAMAERRSASLEHLYTWKDGTKRWLDMRAYPVPEGLAVFWRDITERKAAEERLREADERYRSALERQVRERTAELKASRDLLEATINNSTDMIQLFRAIRDAAGEIVDFRWVLVNPASRQIFGDVEGESLLDRNPGVVPAGIFDAFRRVTETGEPEQAERHYTHEQFDGWFLQSVVRLGDGVATTTNDITEWKAAQQEVLRLQEEVAQSRLRKSERRFQTLAEGIPQLVWRAHICGRWTWASPQWTAFTGQSDADSHDWGWLDPVHPDDRAGARAAWERASSSEGFEADYRLREAITGHYRWFQTRATPVQDEAGSVVEWLGTSTDVQDLREMHDRQGVLVAELQHRTRNLITVALVLSDMTARTSRDLEHFQSRFADRLKALARVQGLLSRLTTETDRVTFDELVRTELSAMDGGQDRVTISGPAGIRLRSSTVQTLAMALHELATNAVKYGALGQPAAHLTISWTVDASRPDDKPWLHIDWRESGVEMPPDGTAPAGSGQGRELIERALPYQLRAETTYALTPDGVHCTIALPVSATTATETSKND
ncbi:PAS domain-containing protein [Paracoccus rhizosphaerae]|uniref:histidine kinase n=1 Tax=Paracoccus rhizosphaerae TaxID=1133347 RepID=A0ABV6CK82_9RHOB|nr:PAS domain-containing protein [Paracoccus rhizosphaerae]